MTSQAHFCDNDDFTDREVTGEGNPWPDVHRFLYGVLNKNLTVTEQNKSLLVETLRSISEILIWGDQNDSSVFDFFLEKNMLAFFLKFMRQKSGRFICVQLLQTLNILFENISNETSVYYLLSNNHINSIIVHKFDFSDEEVMAYYISFLKTLSLKLNKHTIHFFYNEHTNDFALYTEAIKFFNHSESMVRIAVRTITLNVYKVHDKSMLRYIRDKTAAPYFSNLVWFIGNHIIELDSCVRNDADHNSRDRLADLVAEHLDHLHYLNDILCLNIDALNEVLTDHLLNRLFIPLYVYSLTKRKKFSALTDDRPHVNSVVSLFLLSQVFLIISHSPLVRQLADIIFNGDISVCLSDDDESETSQNGQKSKKRGFMKPSESLAKTLDSNRGTRRKPRKRPNYRNEGEQSESPPSGEGHQEGNSTFYSDEPSTSTENVSATTEEETTVETEVKKEAEAVAVAPTQNSTDEEKLLIGSGGSVEERQAGFTLNKRPYLEAIFNALECSENDYEALFALCLLYALGHNEGINQELLDTVLMPTDKSQTKEHYNVLLVEKMIKIINLSCQTASKVRLATLEMSVLLLKQLVYRDVQCFLQDRHLAAIEGAREESTLLLRNFYKVWEKSEEIFLDMFEDEYREMKSRPLNVEYLMMDANILLPPTMTPLTGIEFNKRLPCGEVERARRAIRVFFMLRDLSLTLRQEPESQLPLTRHEECVKITDVLDLNNSDLIACTVITTGDNKRERRFLVIDLQQLILVEPDTRRLGWGVVKFVGFLQDVEVTGDKDDSRSLHITIHRPSMNAHARPTPLLSARFVFDDHIRCMAAKQRLTKGRLKARQRKMQQIARLLELPTNIVESMYQPPSSVQPAVSLRAIPGGITVSSRSHPGRAKQDERSVQRSSLTSGNQASGGRSRDHREAHLGRASSLPMPITRPRPTAGAAHRIAEQQLQQEEAEIEEAEEATPSPEAHAIQSLNASRNVDEQRNSKNGRSTPETSVMEIPLENLGKTSKEKSTASKVADFITGRGGTKKPGGAVGRIQRSSSYSPRRGRTQSPGAENIAGKALRISVGERERSRLEGRSGELRRPRAGSYPSPRRLASGSSSGSNSSQSSKVSSTSFMVKPKRQASVDNEPSTSKKGSAEGKSKGHTRTRSNSSGNCPKTLTPAQEPTVSLITNLENTEALPTVGLASPKLVPPAEPERIRSFSDASSIDSELSANQSNSSTSVGVPAALTDPGASAASLEAESTDQKSSVSSARPPFQSSQAKSASPPDTSSAAAVPERVERMSRTDSASEQLSRLAQISQEQTVSSQSDATEQSVCKSPDSDSANITDDDKETIAPKDN